MEIQCAPRRELLVPATAITGLQRYDIPQVARKGHAHAILQDRPVMAGRAHTTILVPRNIEPGSAAVILILFLALWLLLNDVRWSGTMQALGAQASFQVLQRGVLP